MNDSQCASRGCKENAHKKDKYCKEHRNEINRRSYHKRKGNYPSLEARVDFLEKQIDMLIKEIQLLKSG